MKSKQILIEKGNEIAYNNSLIKYEILNHFNEGYGEIGNTISAIKNLDLISLPDLNRSIKYWLWNGNMYQKHQ